MKGRLIESKTEQEIFDTVVEHLMKQGKRSIVPGETTCVYRGPDGLKCAVGVLIADDEYDPEIERNCWSAVAHGHGFTTQHYELLDRLQEVHDEALAGNFREQALKRARDVAEEHNLNTDALERAYKEHSQCTQ